MGEYTMQVAASGPFHRQYEDGRVVVTDALGLLEYAECLDASDLDGDPIPGEVLDDLEQCGQSGDAAPSVDHFIAEYSVQPPDGDAMREVLGEYGAWEAHELRDDGENLRRVVWLAGGTFREAQAQRAA